MNQIADCESRVKTFNEESEGACSDSDGNKFDVVENGRLERGSRRDSEIDLKKRTARRQRIKAHRKSKGGAE